MRVFISVDLEGISGVVAWEQVMENNPEYTRAVDLMLKEVNAAVEGALDGGADYILVNDSHSSMRNLPAEGLHPKAFLISGSVKPLNMVQGIETGFDLAFFIGYHAAVGSRFGICDHTYSSRSIFEVKWNNMSMNETAINAAVCGYFRVPVALVSGDEETVRQTKEFLPQIETVASKKAVSAFSAMCRPPASVRQEIRSKAKITVEKAGSFQPFILQEPVQLEITMTQSAKADVAELIPQTKRIDGRTIAYLAKDALQAFQVMQAYLLLARVIP